MELFGVIRSPPLRRSHHNLPRPPGPRLIADHDLHVPIKRRQKVHETLRREALQAVVRSAETLGWLIPSRRAASACVHPRRSMMEQSAAASRTFVCRSSASLNPRSAKTFPELSTTCPLGLVIVWAISIHVMLQLRKQVQRAIRLGPVDSKIPLIQGENRIDLFTIRQMDQSRIRELRTEFRVAFHDGCDRGCIVSV